MIDFMVATAIVPRAPQLLENDIAIEQEDGVIGYD